MVGMLDSTVNWVYHGIQNNTVLCVFLGGDDAIAKKNDISGRKGQFSNSKMDFFHIIYISSSWIVIGAAASTKLYIVPSKGIH